MTITRTIERQIPTSKVVVDWSNVFTEHGESIPSLLDWVRTYPCLSDVHVYLSPIREPVGRHLQNTLLSLGCRVTTRAASR